MDDSGASGDAVSLFNGVLSGVAIVKHSSHTAVFIFRREVHPAGAK